MGRMKPALRWYILGVTATGLLAALATMIARPPALSEHQALLLAIIFAGTLVAHRFPVKLRSKQGAVLDTALHMAALLALPLGAAVPGCAVAVAAGNLLRGRPWFNAVFNAGQHALALTTSGASLALLSQTVPSEPFVDSRAVAAVVPAGVLLYLVGTLLVDGAAAIQRRASPFHRWAAVHRREWLPQGALVVLGAASTPALVRLPWLALLLLAPVAAFQAIMHGAERFDRGLDRLATELAEAVEARQPDSARRTRALTALVQVVAPAAGLAERDTVRLARAARLHDLGAALLPAHDAQHGQSLSTRHAIWSRDHAELTASLLEDRFGHTDLAEIVRYHHLPYDGRDQPGVPSGADIPLEARLLGVCETWLDLTAGTARPAVTRAAALGVLRAGANTEWDPRLIEALALAVNEDAGHVQTA